MCRPFNLCEFQCGLQISLCNALLFQTSTCPHGDRGITMVSAKPVNSAKQPVDLGEAKAVATSLSLTSVTFGRYLLVMRSECDLVGSSIDKEQFSGHFSGQILLY